MPEPLNPAPVSTTPYALFGGWLFMLVSAIGGFGTMTLLIAVMSRPNGFGGRDGQGAAALVALILLVAGGIGMVSLGLGAFFGWKLRVRGFRWALWVSLGAPLLAAFVMYVL